MTTLHDVFDAMRPDVPAAPAVPPVLDIPTLDANTMSDRALQREVATLMFDHAPVQLQGLKDAVETGDRDLWNRSAHGIKGAARTIGLLRLAALAEIAERAPSPCEPIRVKVVEALDTARKAIDRHLGV